MHEFEFAIEKPENRLMRVPPEYQSNIDHLKRSLPPEKMDDFFGVSSESKYYRLFHGTIEPRLAEIAVSGMKAFEEPGSSEARIFGTTSPTMAIWHVTENKPHDTLRKQGKIKEEEVAGKGVLLLIKIDKNWLSSHPDSARPLPIPSYLKEDMGITPETDHRINGFIKTLVKEVQRVKVGKEASDFGVKLPVDHIPAEYIFVQKEDGHFQPIVDYVREHHLGAP